MKFALEGDICLGCSESAEHIASEVALTEGALRSGGWSAKRADARQSIRASTGHRPRSIVDNLSSGIGGAVQIKRDSWGYVRTRIESDALREDDSANYVNRRS